MQRRNFVIAGLSSILGIAAQNAPKPGITFGFSLYGMRSLGLDAGLEACAKIGYDAVELPAMSGWPADPAGLNREARAQIRQKLRDLRLRLSAIMENTPPDADDKIAQGHLQRIRAACELAQDLSPDQPPVIETILGGPVGQWEKVRQRFVDRVGVWAQAAAQARVVLAIKPHRLNAMNLPEQCLWLIQQVNSPWVKLTYDYSHFQFRDLEVGETIKTFLPQTKFVHIKDVRVDGGKMQFLLPGDGTIDYVALIKNLSDGGYRGDICVEVSGMIFKQKGYDPLAAARRCYTNLAPLFEKAGVRRG